MLKKTLLASIAFVSFNPTQASQGLDSHHAQAQGQNTVCPPCPCGGANGWVLLPAGPGAPCNQTEPAEKTEAEVKPHHHGPHEPSAEAHHHHPAVKPTLHPLLTPEEEQLERGLKPIAPHIYLRANPNSPTLEKKEGEWGKALGNKVYFKALGKWVYDPSVNATKDIVATGVKDKAKRYEEALKKQQATPFRQARSQVSQAAAGASQEATEGGQAIAEGANQAAGGSQATEGVIPPPPPPPQIKGGNLRKRWPTVQIPGALGTTERPNPVQTEPTMGGNPIPAQGRFNEAQTNIEQRNQARPAEPNEFIPVPPPLPPRE